ncbi:hypothetical protein [Sandaracinus amylolyticus]|uniref:hypothetical protein n=1 Tax=Sandaracinus amylolyticus TaxID=927083 RepID=UPI001F428AA7|nr:hypothetical protein [Sandaracinus amylolyticus]UJR80132.1 Nitrate/nitrite transporter [Sandaracinus amylolyticus]
MLILLTALAFLSGVAVADRLYPESRAERALAACVVALAIIAGSIHALGWLDVLTAGSLAGSVVILSIVPIVITLRRDPRRLLHATRELVLLPVEAIREAWRARSVVVIALPFTLGIFAWTAWLAWLAPSGSWDGVWYHEPMVGFALQNRGFGLVEVPIQLEWVNGYPRTSEHFLLWTTVFGDRRLIDVVPSAMGAIALLAFYVLAARSTSWRMGALGLACVLVTIPAAVLQLRSTYVDLTVLATFLASVHFVTRPSLSARDVWMASLALGLLGGTKANGLFFVGVLASIALVGVIANAIRTRSARIVGHAIAGLALTIALVAPPYWRNYVGHGNPIWPLRYHSELLDVTLEGPHDLTNDHWPLPQQLDEMFGAPRPGEDYHDTRRHAYGYSLTFVALPFFVLGLLRMLGAAFTAIGLGRRRELLELVRIGVVLGVCVLTLLTSPAYQWGRYALPMPAGALLVVLWLLGGRARRGLGEGALGAMIALNLITLFWAAPGWDVTVSRALELARMSPRERAEQPASHNLLPAESSRLRTERIGDGDVVAFSDEVSFLANLWNERMSNRVVFVPAPSSSAFLDRLREIDAEWVVVRRGTSEESALRREGSGYVMLAPGQRDEVIYERAR